MRRLIFCCAVILLANIAWAQSPSEKGVLDLCRKKFQWMIRNNLDSLNQVLDDRLKFIHSNGWIQAKTDVINDLRSRKLVYQQIDLTELSARIYDSMAVVIGRGKFSGTLNSNAFSTEILFTEVYAWKGHTWLLVSRQATKMQP